MGVASDHLVYDYLSQVGDLAQTALPAHRRMRLVTELRNDIDRQRSSGNSGNSGNGDDEATVRRILAKLGTPNEVVKAAAGRPLPRHAGEARGSGDEPGPVVPPPRGEQEPSGAEPEWWRLSGPRGAAARTNEVLAGWSGGVLPPEIEHAAHDAHAAHAAHDEAGAGPDGQPEPVEAAPGGGGRWHVLRRPRRSGSDEVVAVRRRGLPIGPLELLAALALVAGVVVGSWPALAVGWLIAYTTRGLSRAEAKWAALGMPGLVTVGALVWLWGRANGRWGRPVSGVQLGPVIVAVFPVVVKVAAIASALFLLWRSARRFR